MYSAFFFSNIKRLFNVFLSEFMKSYMWCYVPVRRPMLLKKNTVQHVNVPGTLAPHKFQGSFALRTKIDARVKENVIRSHTAHAVSPKYVSLPVKCGWSMREKTSRQSLGTKCYCYSSEGLVLQRKITECIFCKNGSIVTVLEIWFPCFREFDSRHSFFFIYEKNAFWTLYIYYIMCSRL